MPRVVVLTPNPAIDVTYNVAQQELGSTVRVLQAHRRPGGKGVNVVSVLHALGDDAVALLPLGGANGRWLLDALHGDGVTTAVVDLNPPDDVDAARDAHGLRTAGRTGAGLQTRSTVTVVDEHHPPTVYSEAGPTMPATTWDMVLTETARLCEPGGWFVIAGSFPPGSDAAVGPLVHAAQAAGCRVIVDTGGSALLLAAEAGVDLLKPNAEEALQATGETDLARAALRLRAAGTRQVVLSLGSEGLVGHDGDSVARQPAVPGVTGNPTGAGDAATAGLVAALTRGADLPSALRWAAVLGAAAVLSPVAGQVRLADLELLAARLAPSPDTARYPFPAGSTADATDARHAQMETST